MRAGARECLINFHNFIIIYGSSNENQNWWSVGNSINYLHARNCTQPLRCPEFVRKQKTNRLCLSTHNHLLLGFSTQCHSSKSTKKSLNCGFLRFSPYSRLGWLLNTCLIEFLFPNCVNINRFRFDKFLFVFQSIIFIGTHPVYALKWNFSFIKKERTGCNHACTHWAEGNHIFNCDKLMDCNQLDIDNRWLVHTFIIHSTHSALGMNNPIQYLPKCIELRIEQTEHEADIEWRRQY